MRLNKAEGFYATVMSRLKKSRVPFLVGGTYAVNSYTGLKRSTKDFDVFCRAGDMPRLLDQCRLYGCNVAVTDERWLAKINEGRLYVDVIFGSSNAALHVDDSWFAPKFTAKVLGAEVRLLAPTDLIWSKAFVQDRHKYDGSDVAHLLLVRHADVDWNRLLSHFDQYWELLLCHILNFRFIYPSEREVIPKWLLTELLTRLERQRTLPKPEQRVCRGRLFSRSEYNTDIRDWGFTDLVG